MPTIFNFTQTHHFHHPIESVWAFFSNPQNLSQITPPELKFTVDPQTPQHLYAGLILRYKVSPLFNFPMNWVSKITHVTEQKLFVDEQVAGPYKFWHHQHLFEQTAEGVVMKDIVDYAMPFALCERTVNALIVRPKLEEIFRFRAQVIRSLFPG